MAITELDIRNTHAGSGGAHPLGGGLLLPPGLPPMPDPIPCPFPGPWWPAPPWPSLPPSPQPPHYQN